MADAQAEMYNRLLNGCLAAFVTFALLVDWTAIHEGGWSLLAALSGLLVTIGLGEWVYELISPSKNRLFLATGGKGNA